MSNPSLIVNGGHVGNNIFTCPACWPFRTFLYAVAFAGGYIMGVL